MGNACFPVNSPGGTGVGGPQTIVWGASECWLCLGRKQSRALAPPLLFSCLCSTSCLAPSVRTASIPACVCLPPVFYLPWRKITSFQKSRTRFSLLSFCAPALEPPSTIFCCSVCRVAYTPPGMNLNSSGLEKAIAGCNLYVNSVNHCFYSSVSQAIIVWFLFWLLLWSQGI